MTTCSGATTISSVTAVIDRSAEPIMASRPSASRVRAPEDQSGAGDRLGDLSGAGHQGAEAVEGDTGAAKVAGVAAEVGRRVGLVGAHQR